MAPPLACPAPASGGGGAWGRLSCGRIWIRCLGHPARGRRALEAAVPDQAALDAGRSGRPGPDVPAREAARRWARKMRAWGRPSHFGPRLELVQLVEFVAAQNAEKGSKAPSNCTKQCGLRYRNTPLTQAPKSTITSSHANPVRGHGTGQRDEFLDQASAFILQRWLREVWSHSHYLGTSSELRPKKPPTE